MPKPDYRYCVMALFREGNIMESIKDKLSTPAYEKLEELFNKYKKFID